MKKWQQHCHMHYWTPQGLRRRGSPKNVWRKDLKKEMWTLVGGSTRQGWMDTNGLWPVMHWEWEGISQVRQVSVKSLQAAEQFMLSRLGTCWHLISRTETLLERSSNQAIKPGSLYKPTHRRCLWELCLSSSLQMLDLIDWSIWLH